MRRIALLLLAMAVATAEDATSGVPDPYGLGERLALIDWLRDHGGQVDDGIELAELRLRYASVAAKSSAPESSADGERERAALELWRLHSENPAPGATTEQIRQRIASLDLQATEQNARDRSRGEARSGSTPVAAPRSPPKTTSSPVSHTASGPTRSPDPRGEQPAASETRAIALPPDMGAEARAFLISPDRSPILIVVCDASLRGSIEPDLARWPAEQRLAAGVDGTIIIHGHSDGGFFNRGVLKQAGAIGGDLAEHLRRNREYYETMAGTRQRKSIDLAVMTGCNAGGFDQERELKDGLGYRPLHRVFTVPECFGAAVVCVPAIIAAGSTPGDHFHPSRSRFTYAEPLTSPDGRKKLASCFAVVDEDALDVHDQLRKFIVSPSGIREEP